jgi:hypothetical protein
MDETKDVAEESPVTVSETSAAGDACLGMLLNLCMSMAVAAGALLAYHYWVAIPGQQKVGFVDVAEILRLKELEVSARMTQGGRDAEGEAYDAVTRFSADLEAALDDLQQECACTLLVRTAVVKPGKSEDLTPEAKQRLGIDRLDANQLVRQIGTAGGRGALPAREGAPGSDPMPPYR